ncbi:hypothetical protein GE21DRAFT_8098 [Neurospora crassa]|uniref:Uncharacterized protein n=2 Tax=Neurospora crassa TaxID=5141 RepID=Q1K7N9_NEUCR|nr:hypothetical protein NCU04107 [Neurospora crassa OR74A]EAA32027.1 hypothetical protein NCU04107 [Neurospora crassa OR74A]KHE87414.1 hypothetical protein GE21DRAFT_8098 [Neurospora crassa]CAD36968.1 hypothetical protein [Neurospora crassa]|eukprot:XP_961263.1 hypothetical protein NCU04107 [Neurospora crassa OR74A]
MPAGPSYQATPTERGEALLKPDFPPPPHRFPCRSDLAEPASLPTKAPLRKMPEIMDAASALIFPAHTAQERSLKLGRNRSSPEHRRSDTAPDGLLVLPPTTTRASQRPHQHLREAGFEDLYGCHSARGATPSTLHTYCP